MDSAGAPDSLRAVLDAFLENPPVFHRSRIPQSAVQITKATERLIEQFGNLEPKPPSASDLAEIYLRVKNAWQRELAFPTGHPYGAVGLLLSSKSGGGVARCAAKRYLGISVFYGRQAKSVYLSPTPRVSEGQQA